MKSLGRDGAIRFTVLRRLRVDREGVPVALPSKQRTLLAVLLLRAGRPVSVRELGESLWGDDPPVHLRAAVQTRVSRLRAALGGHGRLVRSVPAGYAIQVEENQLDLLEFRRLTAAAQAIRGHDDAAELALLHQALDLWDGHPLADIESEEVARQCVPALVDECMAASERRIQLELGRGGHAGLVPELRALTARYPFREHLWAQLILALHGSGRQAEALHAYETIERLLAEELGIRPGLELRALQHSTLLTTVGVSRS